MDHKVVVTGAGGMLGSTLVTELAAANINVVGLTRNDLDITNYQDLQRALELHQPTEIINCAAWTKVDAAEDHPEDAYMLNSIAPGWMAELAYRNGIIFNQISTDYVFTDNKESGYIENDNPGNNQRNVYDMTKYFGEIQVIKSNPDARIIRTSWNFGPIGPGGKNFVDTMLNLAKTKSEISVVTDEIGVPSYTVDISKHLIYILQNNLPAGFYHAVNEGRMSRYQEAQLIFQLINSDITLKVAKLADFPRKIKVPKISVLINSKLPRAQSSEQAITQYIDSKLEQ